MNKISKENKSYVVNICFNTTLKLPLFKNQTESSGQIGLTCNRPPIYLKRTKLEIYFFWKLLELWSKYLVERACCFLKKKIATKYLEINLFRCENNLLFLGSRKWLFSFVFVESPCPSSVCRIDLFGWGKRD